MVAFTPFFKNSFVYKYACVFFYHIIISTKSTTDFDPLMKTLLLVFYFGSFLFVLHVPAPFAWLSGGIERSDLHADGLQWIPAALPVHPHHTVICAVLCHFWRIGSAYIVSPIWIGWVAAVVPPATSVLPGALLGGIARRPGSSRHGQEMMTNRNSWSNICAVQCLLVAYQLSLSLS